MINMLISGAIGCILGSLAGGYFMMRHATKESDKAIEALKKTNSELVNANMELKKTQIEKREKKIQKAEKKVNNNYNTIKRELEEREKIKPEPEPEEDDEDEEDNSEPKEIRIIDADTFRMEPGFRPSETLTYYTEDAVLVDSVGNKINNQKAVIGDVGIEALHDSDGEDNIYIDNPFDDTLYEIYVDTQASYYRDVLGQY